MSSLVPDDWVRTKLGDLIGVQGGNAFKSEFFCDNGIPIIRISNIKKDGSVNLKGAVYFNEDSSLVRFKAIKGDVLIAMSGATTGKVGRYNSDGFAYINQRVGRFFLKDENRCCIDFIHQITSEDEFTNSILIDAVGGAQPNISNQQIESISINSPPLPEQQKIAQILTSVDEVIEKTQAQIDKLKDLKTGMMQELLTKGVCDEKGKRHFEFKDSPVGRIPVGWEVVEISKLCSDVVDCVNKTAPVVDYKTQYKMIRTTNVRHGRVDTENVRNVTKETYESWTRRLRPENGDLIFTREAPVGECGVLEDSRGVFLGQRTMMYRPNEQLTSSKFLMYSLTSNYGKQQLEDLSGGSTVAHMRVPDCSKILIKTPPIEEQNKIVIAINSIDDSIQKKEIKLAAINSTKKALMQDLLTGKVRVTVNNN
jgi:type I restriction enzyme S subunit